MTHQSCRQSLKLASLQSLWASFYQEVIFYDQPAPEFCFQTPFFDQVIGALIARSCNFQEQNIFMENVQKPGEVKYLQLFDGGAKYLQNSGQVACSSRRLSTPIIAPPKNFLSHFHCAFMSPVWVFFGLNLVWIDVGCWTTPSPLRPSRLLRIDVRLLVAPQESLLPSHLPHFPSNKPDDWRPSLFSSSLHTPPKKSPRLNLSSYVFWLPLPQRAGRPVWTACDPTLTWSRPVPGKAGSQPASQERLRDPLLLSCCCWENSWEETWTKGILLYSYHTEKYRETCFDLITKKKEKRRTLKSLTSPQWQTLVLN